MVILYLHMKFARRAVILPEMLHGAITQDLIGAAMGWGHVVEQQRRFPVYYRKQLVGELVPDLIVDSLVVADPKVVTALNETHVAKMLGYFAITDLEVALLLNFKEAMLHWKRVIREGKKDETAVITHIADED